MTKFDKNFKVGGTDTFHEIAAGVNFFMGKDGAFGDVLDSAGKKYDTRAGISPVSDGNTGLRRKNWLPARLRAGNQGKSAPCNPPIAGPAATAVRHYIGGAAWRVLVSASISERTWP